ncbi:protein kinase [Catellatospora bangladeshensis]|uniref:protein kinase domain-containing protein n=1 Tax=Catellatospora bangladeshensis TaxID=310355 RepID=UPI0036114344
MAPERLDDPQPRVRPTADVYALGVLLYRMLSGDLPWDAESALELLTAAQTRQPRPLPHVPGLPAPVAETITACLRRDPAARPTAPELAALLGEYSRPELLPHVMPPAAVGQEVHTGAEAPLQPWQPPRRRPRRPALAAGLLGAGAVAAAAVWAWNSPAAQAPTAQAAAPSPTASTTTACAVVYQLHTDDGTRFTATLTIANTTATTLPAGQLRVQLPGTQQIEPTHGWRQHDHTATAAIGPLSGAATVRLPIAGTYRGANPLPTSFSLDSHGCSVTLLGPSGQPVSPPGSGPTTDAGPGTPGPGTAPSVGPDAPGTPMPTIAPAPETSRPAPEQPGKPSAKPSRPPRPSNSPPRANAAAEQSAGR